jgi:hypothetical protein
VKLRQLLKRFDLWLRPAHVQGDHGEGNRPDNLDAMTTMAGGFEGFNAGAAGHADVPPNWVPSQQDDRPRH